MKFKPLRDPLIISFYGLVIALYVFAFFVSLQEIIAFNYSDITEGFLDFLIVGASPFVGYLLLNNIINIKYEIINSEKVFSIQSGFVKDRIKLKEVKQIEFVSSLMPYGTMGRRKIKVTLQRPGLQTSYFHIAVVNEQEFVTSLKSYCPDLIIVSPEMREELDRKNKAKKEKEKQDKKNKV
jgi:hypothetical protein